jgi:hypothetical protein
MPYNGTLAAAAAARCAWRDLRLDGVGRAEALNCRQPEREQRRGGGAVSIAGPRGVLMVPCRGERADGHLGFD